MTDRISIPALPNVVVGVFRRVMTEDRYVGRHVDDAVEEIIEEVEEALARFDFGEET